MYNHKTGEFTKLSKKVQKLYDEIQQYKGEKTLRINQVRFDTQQVLSKVLPDHIYHKLHNKKFEEIRDKSVELFLQYGIFGDDVDELMSKSHRTSWYLRRNKVLEHYGDIISTWEKKKKIIEKNEEDKKKTLKELKRIMNNDDEWKDKGVRVMDVLFENDS